MIPSVLMMQEPPLRVGPLALYPWDPMLASKYVVASRYEDDEPMKLWTRVQGADGKVFLGLPWHCCPDPLPGTDYRVAGHQTFLKSRVELRPRQVQPVALMKELLRQGRSFCLNAPTGSGKTIMALDAIATHGRSTLVVPPKDDLMDQWIERAEQALGLKRQQIGRVQGDVCDYQGKDLVIGSLRSLCKPGRYPRQLYTYFGLLVGDEVHRWGADQMSLISTQFYARQRLGLTATFNRGDGKDLMVEAHVGQIEVKADIPILEPKVFRFRSHWVCPRNRHTGERIPHSPGRITTLMPSLCSNTHRNKMICHFARTCFNKGRKTVIFSDYIEKHLAVLEMMLPGWGIAANDIGRYYGSTTKAELERAAKKPVILATYQKMAEGTDIPELDTLIFASPKSNIEQALGRILREHPTKKPPLVFDIVDEDSPILQAYARSRLGVYHKRGATIQEAHIPDEDLKNARQS